MKLEDFRSRADSYMRQRLEDLVTTPDSMYDSVILDFFDERKPLPPSVLLRDLAAASSQDAGGTWEERQQWIDSKFQ